MRVHAVRCGAATPRCHSAAPHNRRVALEQSAATRSHDARSTGSARRTQRSLVAMCVGQITGAVRSSTRRLHSAPHSRAALCSLSRAASAASAMRRSSIFTKKTRSGKILTISREHYLRDDLYCGSAQCSVCPMRAEERKLQKAADAPQKQYFVLDTNVLLHQMDLLEACAAKPERGLLANLILLQTVLDEVRGNNQKLYTRVRAFIAAHPHAVVFCNENHRLTYIERVAGESPNDRNDRAIRVATSWLANHLPQMRLTLLTNDAGNRAKASVGSGKVDNINVPEYGESKTDAHKRKRRSAAALRCAVPPWPSVCVPRRLLLTPSLVFSLFSQLLSTPSNTLISPSCSLA